jgi:hypothetical protein
MLQSLLARLLDRSTAPVVVVLCLFVSGALLGL